MLVLASLSYRFVESPLRFGRLSVRRKTIILSGVSGLVLSATGLYLMENKFAARMYQGKRSDVDIPHLSTGRILRYQCAKGKVGIDYAIQNCMFINNSGGNTIWLLGDSHAETLQLGGDFVARNIDFNFFAYFFGGTAFPPVMHHRIDDKEGLIDSHFMSELIGNEVIKRLMPGDIVLISIRLPYHFGKDKYSFDYPASMFRYCNKSMNCIARETKTQYFMDWIGRMKWLLHESKIRGATVVLTGPTPEFAGARLQECMEQNRYWFNRLKGRDCSISRDYFVGENGAFVHIYKELIPLKKQYKNFFIFNSFDALCPGATCHYSRAGKQLYRDGDHLSNYSSKYIIAPALERFFREKVGLFSRQS